MKIGFTYDIKSDWQRHQDDPADINAEFDKPEAIDFISAGLEHGGHEVVRIGHVRNLLTQINDLDVDIVFNICEGRFGRNRESEVPVLLEMCGMPYCGSDCLTMGITLDKVVAKKCFIADGIPTPKFFSARSVEDLENLPSMNFPLIVKNSWEGTSKGLTESSRVVNWSSLARQVDFITCCYHQPAIIEEFIRGTEYTVAVIGNDPPEAMPVVQVKIRDLIDLGDQFFTYEMVVDEDILQYLCPARIKSELETQLKDLAIRVYKSVGCRDFGRVDFRVDEQGKPFVLEINPLPSLAANDIFNVFPQTMGTTYAEIMQRILNAAANRYGIQMTKKVMNLKS